MAEHAESPALKNQNEVILYFASAKLKLGSTPGRIYLFENSAYIQKLRSNVKNVVAVSQVNLDSQDR